VALLDQTVLFGIREFLNRIHWLRHAAALADSVRWPEAAAGPAACTLAGAWFPRSFSTCTPRTTWRSRSQPDLRSHRSTLFQKSAVGEGLGNDGLGNEEVTSHALGGPASGAVGATSQALGAISESGTAVPLRDFGGQAK
jgi:hypothetical protein